VSDDKRYIVDDQARLSEIAVPVIYKGKVIAVIDSEHPQENYYTREHLGTLQKVASVVSVQLESALNLGSLKRAQRENQALLEKLELSNSELEDYAHIVSHDLKSPLRNIHALVEWIKEDNKEKLNRDTKENLGMIEDTLQKMEGLISGILSFSSINEDSLDLVKTDLYKVVNEALGLIHIPDHVSILVSKDLPWVIGDKIRLRQLFQNLIGNAVRYSDKPESRIEVGCAHIDGRIVFHVKDNGVGIDQAHYQRIFRIFQSLSDKQESTGIGLSIVKKIIDLHKGEIWLESEVGSGTTFYFTLN
jgi:light-regulated signal transduction histidine kinase (bacteriophytochrome)